MTSLTCTPFIPTRSLVMATPRREDQGPVTPSMEWVEGCRTIGESGRGVQEVCGVKTLGSESVSNLFPLSAY